MNHIFNTPPANDANTCLAEREESMAKARRKHGEARVGNIELRKESSCMGRLQVPRYEQRKEHGETTNQQRARLYSEWAQKTSTARRRFVE